MIGTENYCDWKWITQFELLAQLLVNAPVEANPILNEVTYINSHYETVLRNMDFWNEGLNTNSE